MVDPFWFHVAAGAVLGALIYCSEKLYRLQQRRIETIQNEVRGFERSRNRLQVALESADKAMAAEAMNACLLRDECDRLRLVSKQAEAEVETLRRQITEAHAKLGKILEIVTPVHIVPGRGETDPLIRWRQQTDAFQRLWNGSGPAWDNPACPTDPT